jgi:phosphatidylglycerophosphate synthase
VPDTFATLTEDGEPRARTPRQYPQTTQMGDAVGTAPSRQLAGLAAPAVLSGSLAGLGRSVDVTGALAGTALAVVVHTLLRRGLARRGLTGLGPADRVTLARAWLTCGVAALTVGGHGGARATTLLLVLAGTALALDAVDGKVARRTGTVSALGARFDMEVDALLILVLSVFVARAAGWWVLALGLARYAVLAAALVAPWLRAGVAPRPWRKLVAAVQGVVLAVAAGGLLPSRWTTLALAVAAALPAVSFLTEVAELWRRRVLASQVRRIRTAQLDRGLTVGAS